jgi:purine nucleosidase
MTTKVVLDCDTGVDDTMAILYAALHPEIELLAIGAVWGNVDVALAAANSQHAVAMAGHAHVPVAVGAAGPLNRGPEHFGYHVHGDDGQGNVGDPAYVPVLSDEPAAEQLIRLAREHPGEIELIAVGPLTNLAVALALAPELPSLLRGVTIMGGAALAPGNRTPVAEANIIHDVEAAAAVFAAPWPLTMVGLDVTMRALLTEPQRQALLAGGSIGAYVGRIAKFYMDYFTATSFAEPLCCMHDVLAVAIGAGTLEPTLAPVVQATVDTGYGPGRGQTVCDLRGRYRGFPAQDGAHCRVVLECDLDFGQQLVDLLLGAGDSRIPLPPPPAPE